MVWTYAPLEIYSDDEANEFPKEGTPSDWIYEQKVDWCDGRIDEYVAYYVPLWKAVWWKIKWRVMDLRERIDTEIWAFQHRHENWDDFWKDKESDTDNVVRVEGISGFREEKQ